MMVSSICIKDVAANNLLRSTSPMLLELVRKLLLMDTNQFRNTTGEQNHSRKFVHLCDRISFFMLSARIKL